MKGEECLMYLDVFNIRDMPQFFSWHIDPKNCDYHHDIQENNVGQLRIFAEYNIACVMQRLYCFELLAQKDVFTLVVHESLTSLKSKDSDVELELSGADFNEAIDLFIEKIIDETMICDSEFLGNDRAELCERYAAQKEELRQKLRDICNAFAQENNLKKVV